ncbi:hypothetical protein BU23DRAFT_76833 [Bimuria novae-zelandiae CBS 107.79]|uniref:CENP-T/Histone H4 histone fold domain-containing protein n=1 Tax=Bimuria novae-zelandiae CBS 107.79 TaxID=1447943 RepID=A0A6A5VDL6_9PLEO|nr:hypothetical protein BU23DRAFT_76833 [Bimuria novae-zelandiae CBS 107.79]
MSESARKKQRLSPRISGDRSAMENASTLYDDLHRLANIAPKPVTPFRRAASAGITPRSAPIRTPGTGRTPRGGPATRPLPARRVAPTTPHAIRALRERANAARTPGHVRRRSGRVQRETPRDALRALSRALAPVSRPAQPTPRAPSRLSRQSALDLSDIDDDDPPAPRLSMPLDDMYDDDSFDEEPPRQSIIAPLPDYDYDNGTAHSIEFGRRARSEDPRLDRMFSKRISEQFGELNDLTINGEEYELDGNFINRRGTLHPEDLLEQVAEEDLDNTTTEIRALTGRRDGRASDVDLGVFGEVEDEEDDPTFRFTIPPRMQAPAMEGDDDDDEVEAEEETQRRVDGSLVQEADDDDDDNDVQAGADMGNDEDTAVLAADDDDETGAFEIAGWESEPNVEDDEDLQAYRGEVSAIDRSLQTPAPETPTKKRASRQRKALHISRFGHEYPSFPAATVKTLANGFVKSQGSKAKISKDTLAALVQTSDFFFEQVGEDLAAYAQHAGRRQIEESDVIALLKRYVHFAVLLLYLYTNTRYMAMY